MTAGSASAVRTAPISDSRCSRSNVIARSSCADSTISNSRSSACLISMVISESMPSSDSDVLIEIEFMLRMPMMFSTLSSTEAAVRCSPAAPAPPMPSVHLRATTMLATTG